MVEELDDAKLKPLLKLKYKAINDGMKSWISCQHQVYIYWLSELFEPVGNVIFDVDPFHIYIRCTYRTVTKLHNFASIKVPQSFAVKGSDTTMMTKE